MLAIGAIMSRQPLREAVTVHASASGKRRGALALGGIGVRLKPILLDGARC